MAYSKKVVDKFENTINEPAKYNVGRFDPKEMNVGTGMVGAPACGDVMKLQIKCESQGNTHVIKDVKFKTYGCGSAIASSSELVEMLIGKTLEEAKEIKNIDIVLYSSLAEALCKKLQKKQLGYFKLAFDNKKNNINAAGANFRSKNFDLPFGDQSFLINKNLFNLVGKFDENLKLDIKSNGIVYAGRISNSKGVEELLKTWDSLGFNDINLKIIGDGEIKNILQENYKSENVEFLGVLDNLESAEYIKNAKAVITTTKMYEGQSKLITEAFSYGVPAIFPNYGSMKSLIPSDYKLSFNQFDYIDLLHIYQSYQL